MATTTFTFEQTRRYFESRLHGQRIGTRNEVSVKCPFHDDATASLSLNLEKAVWHCHACNVGGGLLAFERKLTGKDDSACWEAINAAIGRTTPRSGKQKHGQLVATYDYRDAGGKLVYQCLRYTGKDFAQRRPDGNGGWVWNMNQVTRVPFNLPALITSNVALVAEGEKDCLNLDKAATQFPNDDGKLTYAATCNVGGAGKWLDEYSPYLAGKKVFVFQDNDDSGRSHALFVCASASKYAHAIHLVELPGLAAKGDVSNYLRDHSPAELFALMRSTPAWKPPAKQALVIDASSVWEQAEGMDSFLADSDEEIPWLIPDIVAPGRLTEIFAPRGLGKSVLSLHWAVTLATQGTRVMLLDRDNPKYTIKQRLRGLGAADLSLATLKVISREKCPPLTQPDAWWSFPYSDFDLVIVDSLDSMAEGVGEQDSSKPAKALAPLLDICHRENGPAVVLLGNTIKSAAHSRGSGVIEDRADIVFEARDATGFNPTGKRPWWEELPAQGAADFAGRATRRTRRERFRLALIATKFRDGEEPAPRVFEVSMVDEPWCVTDVTADVDAEGEAELKRTIEAKAATISKGIAALLEGLKARSMLKREAEDFLQGTGLTRKLARQIVGSDSFQLLPVPGKGSPLEVVMAAKMPQSETPSKNADFNGANFGQPHEQRMAIINPSETLINKGDLETPILAADSNYSAGSEKVVDPNGVDFAAERKGEDLWF